MATQIPTKGAPGQRKSTPAKAAAKKAPPKAPAKKVAGKTIATIKIKKDTGDFTPAKARAVTKKIGEGFENTVKLVAEAYNARIWLTLKYTSWEEWREKEFEGKFPLAMPFVARRAAAAKLVESTGISSRALATVTGTDHATAARDIAAAREELSQGATVANGEPKGGDDTPPIIDADVVDENGDVVPPPAPEPASYTVTGQDGKDRTYTSPTPKKDTIVTKAKAVAKQIKDARIALDKVLGDKDYEANKVDVQAMLADEIGDFVDSIAEDFTDVLEDRLPEKADA